MPAPIPEKAQGWFHACRWSKGAKQCGPVESADDPITPFDGDHDFLTAKSLSLAAASRNAAAPAL
jgi:hypothetical protein